MKENKKRNTMSILNKVFTLLCVMIVMWFVFSYIEVLIKNVHYSPTYSDFNLLKILFL